MQNLDTIVLVLSIIALALTAYNTFGGDRKISMDGYAPPQAPKASPKAPKASPQAPKASPSSAVFMQGAQFMTREGNYLDVSKDAKMIRYFGPSSKKPVMYKVLSVKKSGDIFVGLIQPVGTQDQLLFSYNPNDPKAPITKVVLEIQLNKGDKATALYRVPSSQQLLMTKEFPRSGSLWVREGMKARISGNVLSLMPATGKEESHIIYFFNPETGVIRYKKDLKDKMQKMGLIMPGSNGMLQLQSPSGPISLRRVQAKK